MTDDQPACKRGRIVKFDDIDAPTFSTEIAFQAMWSAVTTEIKGKLMRLFCDMKRDSRMKINDRYPNMMFESDVFVHWQQRICFEASRLCDLQPVMSDNGRMLLLFGAFELDSIENLKFGTGLSIDEHGFVEFRDQNFWTSSFKINVRLRGALVYSKTIVFKESQMIDCTIFLQIAKIIYLDCSSLRFDKMNGKLSRKEINISEEGEDCCICLEPTLTKTVECSHTLCVACFGKLPNSRLCPICRQPFSYAGKLLKKAF